MRKRRRLADKLTIMVCAVLVAVSAFFYVPMDVEASSSFDNSLESSSIFPSSNFNSYNISQFYNFSPYFDFSSSLDNDTFYSVNISGVCSFQSDFKFRDLVLKYGNVFLFSSTYESSFDSYNKSFDFSGTFIGKGSDLKGSRFALFGRLLSSVDVSSDSVVDFRYDYNVISITPLTGDESSSYLQGYNLGYSAGEQAGESNGYSNGYSEGFEAGEQSGYDSGFEAGEQSGYDSGFVAGKESVDTQSYYDMGYSAGYDAGYLSGYDVGYDDGYDDGWQAYEDKISGWGADTTDYPLLISSSSEPFDFDFTFIEPSSNVFVYSDYDDREISLNDVNINPNHTYKLDFTYDQITWSYTGFYFTSSISCWLYWGSSSFPVSLASVSGSSSSFYIPGDRIGDNLRFRFDLGQIDSGGPSSGDELHYFLKGCTFELYDMGPSGNMQNHIANQTDQLTGGFNDSQGNSVNNDFSTGLNEFETAEDSLFATATTGLKDFTFFDIQSVPAMVTGMSFVGSIMSGWFTQAGGASGVGIVLSILFSIMLVAMVLGLYRWYQSKGGKD